MADYYLARSLVALRAEVNARWPGRLKTSDGWLSRRFDLIAERGVIATESGCWEYQGYRNQDGYGQIRLSRSANLLRVHRVMYELAYGAIPLGQVVRHRCDNPPCCNPDHLSLGTQADNIADMNQRGRHGKNGWVVCPNGHTYPIDRPAKVDKNRCRECARERNRRYYERKKAQRGC